jgi:signal transduction histidine kinase
MMTDTLQRIDSRQATRVPGMPSGTLPEYAPLDRGLASSRFAARCMERYALRARLAELFREPVAIPAMALDTAAVMGGLAPLFAEDAPGCFDRFDGAPSSMVRRMLVPLPGDRRLAVDVVPGSVRFLRADLARLLQELVANAWRHSPAGAALRLRGAPGVGGYQLSVTNPGARLPRSVIALLRPGRRADREEGVPGLQLGLSIAATLAELNGTRLEVLRGAGRPNTLRIIVPTA